MGSSRLRATAAVALLLSALPCAAARAADDDPIFAECGIHYPGGFDVNTFSEVKGRVVAVEKPAQGPVRFEVDTGTDRYTVLTGPKWYWSDVHPRLSAGDEVVVRGSKSLGTNGRLYVVAQEVTASGRSAEFRSISGAPLWTGAAGGRGGAGGGGLGGSMGGGMGGMSGTGRMGGMGGMGGGRR